MNYLEFFAVISVAVLPHVAASLIIARDPSQAEVESKSSYLMRMLLQSVSSIVLLAYIATNHPNSLVLLGLRSGSFGLAVLAVLYGSLFAQLIRRNYLLKRGALSTPVALNHVLLAFDSRYARLAYWVTMMFGVLAEELVYRGYLVMWLGTKTGFIFFWALFSIGLSVLIHVYQGRDQMLTHLIYASMLVAVTVFSHSLLPAIAFHMLANTASIARTWRKIDQESNVLGKDTARGTSEPA